MHPIMKFEWLVLFNFLDKAKYFTVNLEKDISIEIYVFFSTISKLIQAAVKLQANKEL